MRVDDVFVREGKEGAAERRRKGVSSEAVVVGCIFVIAADAECPLRDHGEESGLSNGGCGGP